MCSALDQLYMGIKLGLLLRRKNHILFYIIKVTACSRCLNEMRYIFYEVNVTCGKLHRMEGKRMDTASVRLTVATVAHIVRDRANLAKCHHIGIMSSPHTCGIHHWNVSLVHLLHIFGCDWPLPSLCYQRFC
jgi:hypothetical protein